MNTRQGPARSLMAVTSCMFLSALIGLAHAGSKVAVGGYGGVGAWFDSNATFDKVRPHGGLGIGVELTDRTRFRTGTEFHHYGAKALARLIDSEETYEAYYLSFPTLLEFHPKDTGPVRPVLAAGLSWNRLIRAHYSRASGEELEVSEQFPRWDSSMSALAGLRFPGGLETAVRYEHGMLHRWDGVHGNANSVNISLGWWTTLD